MRQEEGAVGTRAASSSCACLNVNLYGWVKWKIQFLSCTCHTPRAQEPPVATASDDADVEQGLRCRRFRRLGWLGKISATCGFRLKEQKAWFVHTSAYADAHVKWGDVCGSCLKLEGVLRCISVKGNLGRTPTLFPGPLGLNLCSADYEVWGPELHIFIYKMEVTMPYWPIVKPKWDCLDTFWYLESVITDVRWHC